MTLYHGSCVGGLTRLEPYLSEHKKPYVYFSTNPVVALLYAVKPVPKPFSFYPYGFGSNGAVVYSEYFENAFELIYRGKGGYLYECDNVVGVENPTHIRCAYTLENPIEVDRTTEITDLFEQFNEYKRQGLFKIKPFEAVSEKEMQMVYADLKASVEKYNLKSYPDNEMSVFIKSNFPDIWDVK